MTLEIGATASRSKMFTDEDVRDFARISGDHNPIHLTTPTPPRPASNAAWCTAC